MQAPTEGGRVGGREGGREGGWEGVREGGRERGRVDFPLHGALPCNTLLSCGCMQAHKLEYLQYLGETQNDVGGLEKR